MNVTSEGERLIKAWLGAQEELRRAEIRINSARCEVSNTESALAKWLLPPDAKPGEQIAVWFSDSLVQVTKRGQGETVDKVAIRSRGKNFYKLSAA